LEAGQKHFEKLPFCLDIYLNDQQKVVDLESDGHFQVQDRHMPIKRDPYPPTIPPDIYPPQKNDGIPDRYGQPSSEGLSERCTSAPLVHGMPNDRNNVHLYCGTFSVSSLLSKFP
jgi:hypothetical protein